MRDQHDPHEAPASRRYRTVFISDVHLGQRAAQADVLLDFLRNVEADTYYLVGDIIDFWKVRRGPHWPQTHNDVLQKLLRKARKGARIVFIPGNHDECMRDYCGMHFGGIEICRDTVHTTAGGRRYAVLHGDEFDVIVRYARWLAFLGDRSYELALWSNAPLNWVRRRFGYGYWSLSAFLKYKVKTAVSFIGEFEHALSEVAKRAGVEGVICGHIHHAANRRVDDVHYLNCGDWVESCTALVETEAGEFHILRWREEMEARNLTLLLAPPVAKAA
jgi:UDP-2,3-diacylglucosamine pyrophosphatase LpxH